MPVTQRLMRTLTSTILSLILLQSIGVVPTADALAFTKLRLCYFYFGTIDDLGWTFTYNAGRVATHEKLVRLYPDLEIESVYEPNVFFGIENKTQLLLDYIATGCNVILTNNEFLLGFNQPATDDWAARTYTNVTFILLNDVTVQDRTYANRLYITLDFSSSFFTAGAAAAGQATKCIGVVSAWEFERNPNDAVNGLMLGVRSVKATLPIEVITMDSWYSPDAEARVANMFLARGCDVIVHYSDPRSVDVAVATARNRKTTTAMSIGPHSNLQQYVGDAVLLAIYSDWSIALTPILSYLIVNGRLDSALPPQYNNFISGVMTSSALSPLASHAAADAYDIAVQRVRSSSGQVFCGPLTLRNGTTITPTGPQGCLTLNEQLGLEQYLVVGDPSATIFHGTFKDVSECPAGTSYRYDISPLIRLNCNVCPANTYSAEAGSATCTECPAGQQSVAGSKTCDPIPQASRDVTSLIAGLVVGLCSLVILFAIALLILRHRGQRRNRYAPREGPLCLLFTDVESSTTLWQDHPTDMEVAMSTHHRVIREVLEEEQAYEVKTVGDSFMIATRTALDGMLVATKIQVRLQEAEWPSCFVHSEDVIRGLRVRIGVHMCRDVHVKYEQGYYDYYGNDVNAAARIESQARGGQILVDQATFAEAQKDVDYGIDLERDIIIRTFAVNVMLKGLDESYTLLSVLHGTHEARTFTPIEGHEKDVDDRNTWHGTAESDTMSQASHHSLHNSDAQYIRFVLEAGIQPLAPSARQTVLQHLCTAHGVTLAGRAGSHRKSIAQLARVLEDRVREGHGAGVTPVQVALHADRSPRVRRVSTEVAGFTPTSLHVPEFRDHVE
jgi:class 3 adenylate cyclase/basic membrane lipoprotein Med (substrate-binding protein (PBP1-ABC) superfamily)